MKKIIILTLVILNAKFILVTDSNPLTIDTTNQIKIQPEQGVEDQPLEKLLEDLKGRSIEKNIEIYYLEKTIKETIIQEAPKEEYLEHLLQALKDSLKKGKKTGRIRRVEKNLIEIDKGAIHKVRERDIYKVYDSSSGVYKGQVEIQAIADAISIGQNYNLKESLINVNDTVKFLGNRKYLEFGVLYGRSIEGNASAGGLVWRYNIFGGWGFEFLLHGVSYNKKLDNLYLSYRIGDFLVGIRKYFNFPSLYSPYIGVGYFPRCSIDIYEEVSMPSYYSLIRHEDKEWVSYVYLGLQLFSCKTLHIDIGAHYLIIPKININSETIEEYPLIYTTSFCMSW